MLRRFATAVGLVLALVLAPQALAGRWVTVQPDRGSGEVRAGENARMGFTVLQHGIHPVSSMYGEELRPYVSARPAGGGESLRFEARREGAAGHFVANVEFPSAGAWEWEAVTEPYPVVETEFESIEVLPAASASPAGVLGSAGGFLAGTLALIAVAGFGLAARRGSLRRVGHPSGVRR